MYTRANLETLKEMDYFGAKVWMEDNIKTDLREKWQVSTGFICVRIRPNDVFLHIW
jgi:hypothetical protein